LQSLYTCLSGEKCDNPAPGAPKISTDSYGVDDAISAAGDSSQIVSKVNRVLIYIYIYIYRFKYLYKYVRNLSFRPRNTFFLAFS
jgi:hypothetical protein